MNFGSLSFSSSRRRSSPPRWGRRPGRCSRGCRSGSSRCTSSSSAAGRCRCPAPCSGGGASRTCTSTACSSGSGGTCCCSSSSWPSCWRCSRWRARGSRGRPRRGSGTSWRSTTRRACRPPTSRRPGWTGPRRRPRRSSTAMESDDLAMVIAFSDRARVVSNYTGDRRLLLAADRRDRADRGDDLAPRGAPGRRRPGQPVASRSARGSWPPTVVPPKLQIYTDGGFADVEGFSLGNLEPEVVVIGPPAAPARRPVARRQGDRGPGEGRPPTTSRSSPSRPGANDEKPDIYQVFGRVHNYRAEPSRPRPSSSGTTRHSPAADGDPDRRDRPEAAARRASSRSSSTCPTSGAAELEVRLDVDDALALDNRAFTLVGNPRKAQVLVVTRGQPLPARHPADPDRRRARPTSPSSRPRRRRPTPIARDVAAGPVRPGHLRPRPPRDAPRGQRPLLRRAAARPGLREAEGRRAARSILDWDVAHPLMQYIRDLSTGARSSRPTVVEPPPGSTDPDRERQGPARLRRPARGLLRRRRRPSPCWTGKEFNTDWYRNYSFPLFLFNSLQVLGNARESAGDEVHLPGQPVVLRAESIDGTGRGHLGPTGEAPRP